MARSPLNIVYSRHLFRFKTRIKGVFSFSNKRRLLHRRKRISKSFYYFKINMTYSFIKLPSMAIVFFKTYKVHRYLILFLSSFGTLFLFNTNKFHLFNYYYLDECNFFSRFSAKSALLITYLGMLPANTFIYNIFCVKKDFIKYARAVNSPGRILSGAGGSFLFTVRLPSTQTKLFFISTKVTTYNRHFKYFSLTNSHLKSRKAGHKNLLGFRSKVRGVAMNPVDHPHGGRTKSIRLPRTPWGLVAKRK